MSGFFGILRYDGNEIQPELLQRVAAVLRFRGLHGENITVRPGVGACFAHLSTGPAPQAAQQPVALGADWLIGDVRLDARRELVHLLLSQGSHPSSDATCEELILQAWKIWGESSLDKFDGDFSFALWDQNRRSLWCARDFVGARPFYYVHRPGLFCFSNTFAALRSVPEVSAILDEHFIGEFLLHGDCSDLTRTVYADIHRLPAGHILQFSKASVQTRRFRTLPIEDPIQFSKPEEYTENYRELVLEAVRDRLPRGATSLYLSGGLDSASVCAMASQLAIQRGELKQLKAFTVDWRPLIDDPEPHFAKLTAVYLGLEHELIAEQIVEPFASSDDPSDYSPQPTSEPFFALAQKQYREIARHSPLILSGDGGDNVLAGQSWPYFAHLWNSGKRQEIARVLSSFIWQHHSLPPLRAGLKAKIRQWAGRTDEWEGYPGWLNPEFEARCGLREKWLTKLLPPDRRHPIHPIAYEGLHDGYWSTVLECEDAGNTHVALETRAPLLDLRVLRFLLRVPPVPWCVNKDLARRSMQGLLPPVVLSRPKTPLVGDPLAACTKTGIWAPTALECLPRSFSRFVDCAKWRATLKHSQGYTSGPNLFPVAFLRWLKDIENEQGIE